MDVENFGDAVQVISQSLGPVAAKLLQELFGWAQMIFQVLVAGSHILTFTICMNTLTDSAACTIIWSFVGLGVFWFLNFPRTLSYASYMSIACKLPSCWVRGRTADISSLSLHRYCDPDDRR
jgi:hypothetical protein